MRKILAGVGIAGVLLLFVWFFAGSLLIPGMGMPTGSESAAEVGAMPEYVGFAGHDGETAYCQDGGQARIPAEGIPDDLPVVSLSGVHYDSLEEAARQADAAAEIEVRDSLRGPKGSAAAMEDGMFRPDPDAACERYGSMEDSAQ